VCACVRQVDHRGGFAEAQRAPVVAAAVDRRGAGGDLDVSGHAVPHRRGLSQRRRVCGGAECVLPVFVACAGSRRLTDRPTD
jgi:hypothetical protein